MSSLPLPSTRFQRIYVAVLALFLVAEVFVAYVAQKPDTTPIELSDRDDDWRLTTARYNALQASGEKFLGDVSLWGIEAPGPKKAAAVKRDWVFKGVVRGERIAALISVEPEKRGERPKLDRYQEGDELPDGSLILEISPSELTYQNEGQVYRQQLHAPVSQHSK